MAENNENAVTKTSAWAQMPTGKKIKIIAGGTTAVLVLTGISYAAIRAAKFAKQRKAVEEAGTFASEAAINLAKALSAFGGVSEFLYDMLDSALPTFLKNLLLSKDSDFAELKRVASEINVTALGENLDVGLFIENIRNFFKEYTRKSLDDVMKNALDEKQYNDILETLNNKDIQNINKEDLVIQQDKSSWFNSQNLIKYNLEVGDDATMQTELKNLIAITSVEGLGQGLIDGGIYSGNGKEIDANKNAIILPLYFRKKEGSVYTFFTGNPNFLYTKGALLGITTGMVARPDRSGYWDGSSNAYFVQIKCAWNGKLVWVNHKDLVFATTKINAKTYVNNGNFAPTTKNQSLKYLETLTKADGGALKGYTQTCKRAKLYAKNGTFPVRCKADNAQPDHFHSFLNGYILEETGDTIKFKTDKNKIVFIPKKTVKIHE